MKKRSNASECGKNKPWTLVLLFQKASVMGGMSRGLRMRRAEASNTVKPDIFCSFSAPF